MLQAGSGGQVDGGGPWEMREKVLVCEISYWKSVRVCGTAVQTRAKKLASHAESNCVWPRKSLELKIPELSFASVCHTGVLPTYCCRLDAYSDNVLPIPLSIMAASLSALPR